MRPGARHVVVIGGGVAGLAAAYWLLQRGHRVTLLEAGGLLGGQVRTFEIGGGRIECFYHHLFTSDTTVVGLIQELGLGDRLVWRESKVGIFHGGRIYDFVTPLDLLRFTPVSLPDRVRLGLAALYLRRQKDWRRYEVVTAEEWIRRYVGRRNFEVVWGPLLRGKFGEAAPEVGMTWFWGKIYVRFASRTGGPAQKERLGYLLGSFGGYIDALVERIHALGGETHTRAPVERVLVEGGRARGVLVGGERLEADAVLCTAPSGVFARMVPELPDEYAELLQGVRYQWATCLVLALRRPLSHVYWLNISDRELPFVGVVEQTNFIEPARYGGHHVVYVSNYVAPGSSILEQDADQALESYLPGLQRINPQFSRDWVMDRWLFKDPAGQPIIGTNYSRRIPEHRTPIAGLYLANTTQIYPEDRGQNYSIRMGEQVAAMIHADLLASLPASATTLP